jgi:putative redox protein
MNATIKLESGLRFHGTTDGGLTTSFDTTVKGGGSNSAPSPMENVLLSAGTCSAMDVIDMIRKARKDISAMSIELRAERATEHPKVFTKIHMGFRITSADVTARELRRDIELSHTKYCSVSLMLSRGGCEITWDAIITRTDSGEVIAV